MGTQEEVRSAMDSTSVSLFSTQETLSGDATLVSLDSLQEPMQWRIQSQSDISHMTA